MHVCMRGVLMYFLSPAKPLPSPPPAARSSPSSGAFVSNGARGSSGNNLAITNAQTRSLGGTSSTAHTAISNAHTRAAGSNGSSSSSTTAQSSTPPTAAAFQPSHRKGLSSDMTARAAVSKSSPSMPHCVIYLFIYYLLFYYLTRVRVN